MSPVVRTKRMKLRFLNLIEATYKIEIESCVYQLKIYIDMLNTLLLDLKTAKNMETIEERYTLLQDRQERFTVLHISMVKFIVEKEKKYTSMKKTPIAKRTYPLKRCNDKYTYKEMFKSNLHLLIQHLSYVESFINKNFTFLKDIKKYISWKKTLEDK